jgi:hypothetical protein
MRALHQNGVGYARILTPALTCRRGRCTGAHVRVQWLSAFQCIHGMVQYVRCRQVHWQLTQGAASQVLLPVARPPKHRLYTDGCSSMQHDAARVGVSC